MVLTSFEDFHLPIAMIEGNIIDDPKPQIGELPFVRLKQLEDRPIRQVGKRNAARPNVTPRGANGDVGQGAGCKFRFWSTSRPMPQIGYSQNFANNLGYRVRISASLSK